MLQTCSEQYPNINQYVKINVITKHVKALLINFYKFENVCTLLDKHNHLSYRFSDIYRESQEYDMKEESLKASSVLFFWSLDLGIQRDKLVISKPLK